MKLISRVLILLVVFCISLFGQTTNEANVQIANTNNVSSFPKNEITSNLFGLIFFSNYGFMYERAITSDGFWSLGARANITIRKNFGALQAGLITRFYPWKKMDGFYFSLDVMYQTTDEAGIEYSLLLPFIGLGYKFTPGFFVIDLGLAFSKGFLLEANRYRSLIEEEINNKTLLMPVLNIGFRF